LTQPLVIFLSIVFRPDLKGADIFLCYENNKIMRRFHFNVLKNSMLNSWLNALIRVWVVLLILVTAPPITVPAKSPELTFYAQMGASFATIDVKVNLKSFDAPTVYYLAFTRDTVIYEPDAEMIMDYANGVLIAGLDDGQVVGGRWIVSFERDRRKTLSGGEDIPQIQGKAGFKTGFKAGFIDGYRYDLYMVAVDGTRRSNVAVVRDIMAMPFDGIKEDRVYTIRALDDGYEGRQLANIRRLSDLYYETKGLHGSLDFLDCDYMLISDIDLSDINLTEEENWMPMDFYGNFDGQGHCIRNLRGSGGVFGTLDGASVKNLHIEDAHISLEKVGTLGTLGAVAGEAVNTTFENICVENVQISGGIATGGIVGELGRDSVLDICRFNGKVSGYGHVGGLIGAAYSEEETGITIKNGVSQGMVSLIINEKEGSLGGLAGTLIGCTVTDSVSMGTSIVSTSAKHIGGFVGQASNSVFIGCRAARDVKGKHRVGGFGGLLTEAVMMADCHASGDVYGERVAGGFIGAALGDELSENANHSIKMVQCHSLGMVEVKGGMAGGFAGSLAYTAVDACSGNGDVYAAGPEVGGFVGRLTRKSRITNACAYGDVANVPGSQTGGFVGLITYGSGIEYAFSVGSVVGQRDTGGFAGAISASGAPNTLFGCVSFGQWVSSDDDENLHRLVGRMDHRGVNSCYAYLGSVVAGEEGLRHVSPNPYGADGGDVNNQTVERILARLSWDRYYWSFDWDGDVLKKPRLEKG